MGDGEVGCCAVAWAVGRTDSNVDADLDDGRCRVHRGGRLRHQRLVRYQNRPNQPTGTTHRIQYGDQDRGYVDLPHIDHYRHYPGARALMAGA